MRRFAFFIAALAPLVAFTAGCEDGPNQTYSPASGTNNGTSGGQADPDGGYVGNGTQGYDAGFGGTNANDLCTADQEKAVWTKYFQMPILPPGLGGGIDIAGGVNGDGSANYDPTKPFSYDATKESWTGATVEQAEKILCQGTADNIYYGVTNTLGWGESLEFSALYNTNSRQITDLLIEPGYAGNIPAKSADGKTTYTITFNNQPISMTTSTGTQQLLLDWTGGGLNAQVNALWDALRATYAPSLAPETDCVASGHCIIGNNKNQGGYLWFTPINLSIFVATTVGTPQAGSIAVLVDLGLLKLLPFSTAGVTLKLDAEGPTAITPNVGGTGKNCKYVLGMNFGDFDSNCVEPFPSGNTNNTINKAKLFGAMSHGDEAFAFDIVGVDPQFAASSLPANQVVSDAQRPAATDTSYDLTVDQEVLGRIANDYVNNDVTQTKDLHGSGLLTLEWANLVQQYFKAAYGVTANLGDPACIANPVNPAGKTVCSGIEGIVTTAPTSAVPAASPMLFNAMGVAAAKSVDPYLALGMKPGTWYSVFCGTAYKNCFGGAHSGGQQYFFDTMQSAVATAFQNNPSIQLPNRRFYFQQWILALVKYLQSATVNNGYPTLAQIDANPADPNNMFFDSAGGGFETGVYEFRDFVNSNNQPPTDLEVTTNLTTSVINDYQFQRYNFRGEKALYSVLQTTPTDKPGAEPIYLSNMVGSSVLQSTYGSYACAINTDPHNVSCGYSAATGAPAKVGPTDAFGVPLFKPYQPAFGQSMFNIAANNTAPLSSPLKVDSADFTLIESGMASMPIWANPYDPTSAKSNDPTAQALLPYLPKGADVGFPVTIDGSRDKFYNTNSIDFTGSTVSANVDFEPVTVATANGSQTITVVRAVETQNYLGLVFACAETDPNTGEPDVLAVRMYQPAKDILNWIAKYPENPAAGIAGAASDCGIQIKYSIYGNYADYISFLTTGVRFGLNPGFGGSVVSDVTVFDPNVVATLGQ